MNKQPGNGWRREFQCNLQLWIAIFLILQGGSAFAQRPPPDLKHPHENRPAFHPNRLLVKPKAALGNGNAKLAALNLVRGGRVLKSFPKIGGLQVIEFPAAVDIVAIAGIYSRDPSVEYAELDYEVHISATPNDPQYSSGTLWGLNNTGQNSGLADADIDAPEGWNIRTQATNVIVAVIDTGIRYTHQDLAANMWVNPLEIPGNGIDDDGDGIVDDVHGINAITMTGDPMDDHGHGTHVAGTIGAVGNNGLGVVGVAWNVQIMACKFLNSFGSGYDSDAITCVDYAREHGANVMNNSWGGPGQTRALADAIEAARLDGVIFVAAAGNSSVDNDATKFYPSGYSQDNIIAVAATTRTDALAYFSNYGQSSVDVAAPGLDIISTWYTSDSAYNTISGTSMATPAVSGLVALMKAQFPADNYRQLLNRIYASVDPINVLSNKCRTGGRINLAKALASVSSAPGNDSFTNRKILGGGSVKIEGINVDATTESGEPIHAGNSGGHSIWYSWRPSAAAVATLTTSGSTFDTLLAVYTGSSVSNLTLVASNDNDPAGGTASLITFDVVAGTDYQIAVDGANGATGSASLNITTKLRPANDNFANRIGISSLATVTGSNVLATVETGEPSHANQTNAHSVWWSWTAPTSETVTISTLGSSFDTVLAVYTGSTISNLTAIASNDNDPAGGTTSLVTFSAVAGTTYKIAVDGHAGATGNITLNTPPVNDRFANRIALAGASVSTKGFNTLATKEALEPNHAGNSGGKSLWWSWTAPSSTKVTVNTLGSTFDTLLAIYTGTSVGSLSLVASNNDGPYSDFTSLVTFNAVSGTTYQIAVDGGNGSSGTIQLAIGNNGYSIADMGSLPGFPGSGAYSINISGVVAGMYMTASPDYTPHACIWTSTNGIQPILTGDTESEASAINDNNQVVGYLGRPGISQTPFLWQNGVVTELGGIGTTAFGGATAIDNAGHIVGWLLAPNNSFHGFYYYNGVMKDLGAFGTDRTRPYGLNGPDLIVGGSGTYDAGPGPAVMWNKFLLSNISVPSGNDSTALSVNSLSQIAGVFYNGSFRHAFLSENGVTRDLGSFTSGGWTSANAINNLGQIVGDENYNHALIWENGSWTGLESFLPANSGWSSLFFSYDINDRGQIAGAGTFSGQTHGYVLTPLRPVTPRPFIQSPTNQQQFFMGQDIPITINLVPDATTVEHVDFYADGILIGSSSNAPFSLNWTAAVAGSKSITAQVTSVSGGAAFSPAVSIFVVSTPSLTLQTSSDSMTLSWSVSDASVYTLESTTNLTQPIVWVPETNDVTLLDGINSATLTATNEGRFFRLRKEP